MTYQSHVEFLQSLDTIENIPEAFFNPLVEKLKMYFVIGGMPEAVLVWSEDNDVKAVDTVLANILDLYERDFFKHAPNNTVTKIKYI